MMLHLLLACPGHQYTGTVTVGGVVKWTLCGAQQRRRQGRPKERNVVVVVVDDGYVDGKGNEEQTKWQLRPCDQQTCVFYLLGTCQLM